MHEPQRQNERARSQAVFRIVIYVPENPYAELCSQIRPRMPECWGKGGEEEVGVSARSIALERGPARLNGFQIRILLT